MNSLGIIAIIAVFGALFLIIQAAFHFSRYVKTISSDMSLQLRQINDSLHSHFVDSSKMIQDVNQHVGARLLTMPQGLSVT